MCNLKEGDHMARNELSPLVRQLFGLTIGQGVLAIFFGIFALFWPGLTVALLIVLFSVFILIAGVVAIISSLSTIGIEKFWWLELIYALLAVGLGVFLLRNPIAAGAIFILAIGITFIVRGVVDLLKGLFDRERSSDSRTLSVLVGVLGLVAGIITLLHPLSAGVAVVWVVGLYAVLYGAFIVAFAFREQRLLAK